MFEILVVILLFAILCALVWVASATYSMFRMLGQQESADAISDQEIGLNSSPRRSAWFSAHRAN